MKENLQLEYKIRLADVSDAETIQRLVNSAYRGESSRRGWTTEADILGGQRTNAHIIQDLVEKENSVILVLESSTDLSTETIACVHLKRQSDGVAYFGMFTVKPDFQGKGIGKRLMNSSETYVKKNWLCQEMEMTVISIREELIDFYVRQGFYKTERWVDFPYGDERFGLPLRPDLKMITLRKSL